MINQNYQDTSSLSHSLKKQTEVCEGCAGTSGTSEMHPCPMQCKINGDESDFCNCCLVCEQDCSEI